MVGYFNFSPQIRAEFDGELVWFGFGQFFRRIEEGDQLQRFSNLTMDR